MAGADDLDPEQRAALDALITRMVEHMGPLMLAEVPASAETWSHAIAEACGIPDDAVQVRLTAPEHAEIAVRTPLDTSEITLTITRPEEDPVNLSTPDTAEWRAPWCRCNQPGARHPLGHHAYCRGTGVRSRVLRTLARLRALVSR